MPTPAGTIINAATTLSQAYVAAGVFFSFVGVFLAFALGKPIASWIIGTAKRALRR